MVAMPFTPIVTGGKPVAGSDKVGSLERSDAGGSSAPAGSASPHWPTDRSQAFIKLFDGTVSSSSLRAVSMPATGSP